MAGTLRSQKSFSNWGRLRQVADPLDEAGFVSKGDTRLLDPKAQASYYSKIVDRYLQFCGAHAKNLDAAFASLPRSSADDPARNPPAALLLTPARARPQTPKLPEKLPPLPRGESPECKNHSIPIPAPESELSILLLSLRKLREAILASGPKTSVSFSQRVYVFSIRLAVLAQHPPSYSYALVRLLDELHSSSTPLSPSELQEFTTYLILDYACRQDDMAAAFKRRACSKAAFGYHSNLVDRVLSALVHDNWVAFWKARKDVDGYTRAVMNWAVDGVRRRALKAVARAYLSVDVKWVVEGCAGNAESWNWEKLVEKEGLGWTKEGNKVVIRGQRPRGGSKKEAGQEEA